MDFQENTLNGRKDTAERVPCSQYNVSVIIDRSLPKIQMFFTMGLSARYGISRKSLEWKKI